MTVNGWIALRARSLLVPAGRVPGAVRGLVLGIIASAAALVLTTANRGGLLSDHPWNDFEIPVQLTLWLAAPSGLIGGWLFGPMAARSLSARGLVGTVLGLAVVTALIGVVLFALAETPFAVLSYGPAGLIVVPFVLVTGSVVAVFELPITLPAAAIWVAWMRVTARAGMRPNSAREP